MLPPPENPNKIFLDAFADENEHAIRYNYLFSKNK